MECNREEAMRAKEIAESRMANKEFVGARKFAVKAQQLFPDLDNISHMILVCDVHISSEKRVLGDEKDWYSILNIDPSADESSIKKQYRKYALSLHPDKNNFPGSTDAFKLIGEAQMVLLDRNKRAIFDSIYKVSRERNNLNHKKGSDMKRSQSPRNGQSGVSNDKSTLFWTLCPSCCVKYKFSFDLVNRSVWCQTCKVYFTGHEIKVQDTPKQKKEKVPKKWSPKKSNERSCENFTRSNGKRTGEPVAKKESEETNKKFKSSEKSANGDTKTDKGNVADRAHRCSQSKIHGYYKTRSTEDNFSGQRRGEPVEMKKSEETNKKFKSSEKSANGGTKNDKGDVTDQTHSCSRSKIHGYYYDTRSTTEGKFSEHVRTNNFNFLNEKDNINKTELKENGSKLRGNGCEKGVSRSYGKNSVSERYRYPDPDFHNFDVYRTKECFRVGDIWAVYDTIDAMPRFYALVTDVVLPRFKLLITWLEPNSDDKAGINWVNEGLPVSCGKFKNGECEIIDDHRMFSHLVHFEKDIKSDTYKIYPKKGETWALFKSLDCVKDIKKNTEFEYVEVVSDYAEDRGVWVTNLSKVKGFSCLFCQSGKIKDLFQILPNQAFRFSHKIPSFLMSGDEKENIPEGSYELDPTSLPPDIEEFDIQQSEKMANMFKYEMETCIDSDFNDFETSRTEEYFSVGQIWALYDSLDAMPRFYALLKKVSFSPVFEVQLTWLEPDPSENEKMKWVNEGLPVSCGKFKLGNSEIIKDHLMFSHLVFQEISSEREFYRIYPKKGETWALFKDWNMKWINSNLEGNRRFQFEFVEILSDYDTDSGVSVAYLGKVKGFSCLFCRNATKPFQVPSNEIFRFSHRVLSIRMNGDEQKDVPMGSFELDPGSLPSLLK